MPDTTVDNIDIQLVKPPSPESRITALENDITLIKQAIKQLFEIDRRYATPPADSIKGALEEILNQV